MDLEAFASPLVSNLNKRKSSYHEHQPQWKKKFNNNLSDNSSRSSSNPKGAKDKIMFPICHNVSHPAYHYKKFKEATVSQRLNWVKQHKLCSNCLHHSHSTSDCKSTYKCRHCDGNHNHVHVTTMPHECQVRMCMCYSATCMSSTHVHVATMSHACQVHMCMLLLCHMHVKYTCSCRYYATCMSSTHVHVATMPHACQKHMCMLLLYHVHVKYTCAYCYYATCMSNTHVHIATMPHAYQTLMCMLLLCHVHVNLPMIP